MFEKFSLNTKSVRQISSLHLMSDLKNFAKRVEMAKNSKQSGISNILGNGFKLYVQNIISLTEPVFFVTIAQFIGIILIFLPVYYLVQNINSILAQFPFLNNFYALVGLLFLSILPGLLLFKLSFWDYMIKTISLNLMIEDIVKKKQLKNHRLYTQIIKLRSFDYLMLLLLCCLLWLLGTFIPFGVFLLKLNSSVFQYIPTFALDPRMVLFIISETIAIFILCILSVYLSLSFQVFAYENSLSPIQALERSFHLVLNNFWRTLFLGVMVFMISNILLPQAVIWLTDIFMLKSYLAAPFEMLLKSNFTQIQFYLGMFNGIPLFDASSYDKSLIELSKMLSSITIMTIVSLILLPLGTACYALLYLDIKKHKDALAEPIIDDKKSRKKPSK